MSAPAEQPQGPTGSPYWIEADEGPQTISELKAALAAWPDELMAFSARLEAARFEEIRDIVKSYRMVWLSRTHPAIRAAVADSEVACTATATWDEVMADYDEHFELKPDPGTCAEARGTAR